MRGLRRRACKSTLKQGQQARQLNLVDGFFLFSSDCPHAGTMLYCLHGLRRRHEEAVDTST